MASLRRVARKCPVLRECQQCIRDSVEFPASSSSTVTSQHNRVAAPCAHFVPRDFHQAVMSRPCSCQRRIARHIEDSGKQLIVLSVDFCAQLVPNDAKRPPGGGGRSRVVRGSCPSWARTRTLLIQSQAGNALNSGNLQSNRKFASSAAGVNLIVCRVLPGFTHTETRTT